MIVSDATDPTSVISVVQEAAKPDIIQDKDEEDKTIFDLIAEGA